MNDLSKVDNTPNIAGITIEEKVLYGELTTVLSSDTLGRLNSIFVDETYIQICLSDWYGRRSPTDALEGIDKLIALLNAAKQVILNPSTKGN